MVTKYFLKSFKNRQEILKEVKKYGRLLVSVLFLGQLLTAKSYSDLPTGQFLLTGQGARAEGLGQSAVSNSFDYTAAYWNPAGTVFVKNPIIGVHQAILPAKITNSFLSFVLPFKHLAFGVYSIGEQATVDSYTNYGQKTQAYEVSNNCVNFSMSVKMFEYFSLGAGIGPVSMKYGTYTRDTSCLNIGSMFLINRFSAGVAFANLGGSISPDPNNPNQMAESLPSLMRAGISCSLLKNKNLLLSCAMQNVSKDPRASYKGFGIEYITANVFALRVGAKADNNSNMSPSIGLGLIYKRLNIDYSFTGSSDKALQGAEIHRLGLSFKLGHLEGQPVQPEKEKKQVEKVIEKPVETPIEKPLEAPIKITNLAVADFSGKNVSQADASIVADFIRTELVSFGTFNVIEKANMDKILAESSFQQSGCTTSECAVQIGKILNVKQIVVGSLSKLMDTYYITINLVDVETSKIVASYDQEAMSAKELRTGCRLIAEKLVRQSAQ